MIGSVTKKVLKNGLTVLMVPRNTIPKVSLQIWYGVGSRDELTGQRGVAHLIEHMIFKGTETLNESDINALTYKLSATCNAFTSHDYTGYLFDVPSQHWNTILPVMADCMVNCLFKQEFLNSELKAVIQELKMYNDDYLSVLLEKVVTSIFPDHPYHYPIIGYKQDLWNLNRSHLEEFYRTYYGPNNATLVMVGDIDPEKALEDVEREFDHLKPLEDLKRRQLYHGFDLARSDITIYRDIKQPLMVMGWVIPGVAARKEYLFDLMSWIIGAGRGATLYNKLVTELGIATELQSFVYDLFEHGIFFIYVQPRDIADVPKIKEIIYQEIEKYRTTLISDEELERAKRKTAMDLLTLEENNQRVAYLLGKLYTATGDENYLTSYVRYPEKEIKNDIKDLFERYFAPSLVTTGMVLPVKKEDNELWRVQQQISDGEDARVLSDISREATVEQPDYATKITVAAPKNFVYPKPEIFTLSNGLKVFACDRPDLEKIDIIVDLKAKHYYDGPDHQGLSMMVGDLLQEGTTHHNATQLAQELESLGMELNTFPGQIGMTMLSRDIKKGLSLLHEVLTEPAFDQESIDRIRTQLMAELNIFWDTPSEFVGQLARQTIYQDHPYGFNVMGTEASLAKVTRDEIITAYQRSVVPFGGRLGIVGNLSGCDYKKLLEESLGSWRGPEVPDFEFPPLKPVTEQTIDYPINRDQIVLAYGGLSISRTDPDFDALLLFDQIFTGGVLGSMDSRLFALREQTGLFYTVGGSVLAGSSKQPGMVFVKAIVSPDRLQEAEQAIEGVMAAGADDITPDELSEARNALINSFVDNFASNRQIAATFLVLDYYGFGADYFDKRPAQLEAVTKDQIIKAVKRIVDRKKMVKFRVGRV